ncbi:MAG: ribosomal protein L7/L12 [Myxococcales bacterium]|nr:ribosomal protein L7/L12 [Myxococcales bacterium]
MNTEELLETIRNLDLKQTRALADALRETLHIDALPSFTDEADRFKGAINPPSVLVGPEAVNVILAAMGANKIQVIKVVREATGLGLAEAKAIVEAAPKTLAEDLPIEDAKTLAGKLEAAGATVRIE